MEVNLPIWGYYAKDFVDPLYVPYVKSGDAPSASSNSHQAQCGATNVFADSPSQIPCQGGMTDPRLVKDGWGLRFQRLHPEVDACPEGWKESDDGYCVSKKPEFDTNYGLYSKHAFVPKYQHFAAYGILPRAMMPDAGRHTSPAPPSSFDQKSVNPYTGDYVTYFRGHPVSGANRYVRMPSSHSLL